MFICYSKIHIYKLSHEISRELPVVVAVTSVRTTVIPIDMSLEIQTLTSFGSRENSRFIGYRYVDATTTNQGNRSTQRMQGGRRRRSSAETAVRFDDSMKT